jgi:23S rRNA G2445 N2-methylase RlmL
MSIFTERRTMLVSCARGIPSLLSAELRALGYPVHAEQDAGVETEGTVTDAMRMNLFLRTGNRVLYELDRFPAHTPDQLYERLHRLPWEAYLPDTGYVTVASFVQTPGVRDGRFANVKAKDAIVDRIREQCGHRPDSGNERSGAVVFLYWREAHCKAYLDTSGESLSRRGYRKIPLAAPMQETLAAAVVQATGWTGAGHFVNPMCGSGTLAIEAALIGLGRPPGLLRSNYGFMHLKGFDAEAWQALRTAARAQPKQKLGGRIVATDIRPETVAAAQQNAKTAGVDQLIEFGVCDFAETPLPEGGGAVVLNPEYGERMGAESDLEPLYRRIGDFFKQRFRGYTGYGFTGDLDLAERIGVRSKRRILFFNGPIECRLLAFELYEGTRRPQGPE